MIITIDTTKDTIDAQDIYSDSDLETLNRIKYARFNEVRPDSEVTLKRVINYLKNQNDDSVFGDLRGKGTIPQIKLVLAVTDWGLRESKDFVEQA